MEPVVLFRKEGHVAIFTLNRPKAMNAVSADVSAQMERHMDGTTPQQLCAGLLFSHLLSRSL